jgi:hypothetical protein
MEALRRTIFFCLLCIGNILLAQKVDSVRFFVDEPPLNVTISTDMAKLMSEKMKGELLKATISTKLYDSSLVEEEIRISARGAFRRKYCYIPPMLLNFQNTTSPRLRSLKALKMVSGCTVNKQAEQLLLKEYLVYKIHNLVASKSFLTRLAKVTYRDGKGKKKPFTQYAFFLENVDAMAKRNHCKEWKNGPVNYHMLDRKETTMMFVFQYMIGNTDWGLTNNHNLKIMYGKKDTSTTPFAVPYDFDYCGLVNAEYAVPNEELGITTVVQRLYRGFPRSAGELQTVFDVFNTQKEKIYNLISDFELLDKKNKKEMIAFLDDFYKTINQKWEVQSIFIKNARHQ